MNDMDTKEINLIELFFYVLSKWRFLLVGAVICGLLLGGFGAIRAKNEKPDEEGFETAQQEYKDALKAYETNQEKLRIRIDNLEDNLAQQQYIQERSIMLEMDPYNIYEAVISYYVDTGYEIVPELYYQDPNYTSVITNSYNAALQRLNVDELFATEDRPEVMTDNPVSGNSERLLSVSVDAGNGTLTVTARADSQENLDRMTDAIQETIDDTKKILNKTIGEHTLSVLDFATSQTVDFDYATLQQNFSDNIYNLMQSLADANDELSNLEEPVEPAAASMNVKQEAIKFGVIGVVVGILLVALIFAFLMITKDPILSLEEIKSRYQIPVLGMYHGSKTKRRNKLDAWIAGKLGVMKQDSAQALDYIKASKDLYLADDSAILVSASAENQLEAIVQELADGKTTYSIAGDLSRSAAAVASLGNASSVICVEKWMKSGHEELRKELDMISKVVPKDKIAMIVVQ